MTYIKPSGKNLMADTDKPRQPTSDPVSEGAGMAGRETTAPGSALKTIRRSAYLACVLLLSVVAGVTIYRHFIAPEGKTLTADQLARPAIGGPFELTAHTGDIVTEKTYAGRHTLIFFGYTYCPDVCPTTLQEVSGALDDLGVLAEQVQPLFVTVDPERDDQAAMADYVSHFHPSIVGLTGNVDQTTAMARAYRVYFAKVPEWKYLGLDAPDPNAPEGQGQDQGDGDYLMDHSSVVYLMGPDGRFVDHLGANMDATQMAERLKSHLGS